MHTHTNTVHVYTHTHAHTHTLHNTLFYTYTPQTLPLAHTQTYYPTTNLPPFSFQSPRRTLQRTFSDESLCSGRRDASYANSAPLFDQGTPSDLLFTCTLPTRRHAHSANHVPNKKGEWGHSLMSLPSHFIVSVHNYGMSRRHKDQLECQKQSLSCDIIMNANLLRLLHLTSLSPLLPGQSLCLRRSCL